MNKLIRLSPTGIEYGDYAWNFVSGCSNNIDGKCKNGGFNCWAYSITQRFKSHYPNGFKPAIYPEAFCSPLYLKKPSRILCAFMGDLFGDGFNPNEKIHTDMPSGKASITMSLKGWIFTTIRQCPQHRFLFLTKQPWNLIKFSPFPDNCFVGVSVCNDKMLDIAVDKLEDIEAKVKYFSFEPLQKRLTLSLDYALYYSGVKWVIIGAQTKPYKPPEIEHVEEIVRACDKAGVKVFLKDNLSDLIPVNSELRYGPAGELRLRQELPT